MNRNEFMKSLEQHYPDDMNDEQLDALEQFSFKLFDAGFADLKPLPTQEEIDGLKQRNAELMAQVERLRKYGNLCAVNLSYSTDAFASEYKELWKKAAAATPTQCLAEQNREVAARAGREGFMNGATLINIVSGVFSYDEIHAGAEEYANKIKSGEVEV